MSGLARFGISMEKTLLEEFDRFIKERNYTNYYETIPDLISMNR